VSYHVVGGCPHNPLAAWCHAVAGQPRDASNRGSMPDTLTLAQAAEQTGLTAAALARRVERGTLRAVLIDGKRRVPVSELERAGLLAGDQERDELGQLRADLAAARALTQRAEATAKTEVDAHERTKVALAEHAATAKTAQAQTDELRADLDAIVKAGPIRALRLRRAIRRGGVSETAADRDSDC